MDAVEFFKTVNRLCKNQRCCKERPIHKNEMGCIVKADDDSIKDIEKIVSKVEQWAKDNPVKTRQSEFLRMFPKAEMKDDYLWMCPKYINYDYNPEENCHEISCSDCKRKFWLTEVTDAKQEE